MADVRGVSTEPGFASAFVVLAALFVLWLIATRYWDRIGPAWAAFWAQGQGTGPVWNPDPAKPPSLDIPPVRVPWKLWPTSAAAPGRTIQWTPAISDFSFGVTV